MGIELVITTLGDKFQDYRDGIPGDSYNWGPVITASNIKYFAFHHSVTAQTAKNDGNWKAECDQIANEHLAEGWGGVGYRFIICSDGTVAYVGDLSHGGSAVAGNNDIIFSACLVGDFTKELPTAYQIDSANKLMNWFLYNMPQYPNLNSTDQVIGHQDAAALLHLPGATPTACPGPAWRDPNDSLKNRIINDHWQGYPSPEPPTQLPPVQPPAPTQSPVLVPVQTAPISNPPVLVPAPTTDTHPLNPPQPVILPLPTPTPEAQHWLIQLIRWIKYVIFG